MKEKAVYKFTVSGAKKLQVYLAQPWNCAKNILVLIKPLTITGTDASDLLSSVMPNIYDLNWTSEGQILVLYYE
jgi:hypothetical protein